MEEKKKKDDWIRMASKSRPGRFYLFNKATGETQWLPLHQVTESDQQKQESPPKLSSFTKSSKTPAQDRLKRLQHNLKSCQTRSSNSRITRRQSSDLEAKSKEQENKLSDQPSTSTSKPVIEKSPKKATKRSQSGSIIKKIDNTVKITRITDAEEAKKIRLSESSNSTSSTSNKSTKIETATEVMEFKSFTSSNGSNLEHLSNTEQDNSSSLNNLRCGIVKKIKEICKIPFNISKKKIEEKSCIKEDKSTGIINTTHFKPVRKTKDIIPGLSLSTARDAIYQLREESIKNSKAPNNKTEFSTPKNINIPTYPRGSANSRLERLKQSLLLQQHDQQETSTSTSKTHEIPNTSCESNNNTVSLQSEDTCHNNSKKSLNETLNDDVEAMDWQPIVKDDDLIEVSSSESSFVIEKSKKLVLRTNDENTTMGDIYDTVNENLLRFSAEKHKDSANHRTKWRKDFYYFIVDTNVLLKDLTFVEDLTKMKLCDTKGSMLYIPYSVLQELDKLKMRSGCQEGVKTLAVRAIKYLNSKFENNSPNLRAQSALDERHHLVDINSADDSIINCCLQTKEQVPNLLLLTEDVNLRNKAICNNILVSTKSDLLSKRYNTSNGDDKS
ncbi:transcriptional protein SWT1 [Lucilia cuprina]|uniref:transcriptional protein SWT1 n=1 Tax=Lucilia cuprina TaxID=7375 RepID=UPI001F060486|nr:transcriptional protein SWT1 [Lucilia cuprina]